MKVFLYKVTEHDNHHSLNKLLDIIMKATLKDRVRLIGDTNIRIEDITLSDEGFYYIDMVMFRDQHGPGRGDHSSPVIGFTFQTGESFCEQTACLYDPKTRYLTLQYNHHGVRSMATQNYFNEYLTSSPDYQFELMPKYDDDTMRRFNNKVLTKSLNFTVDTRFMSASDRKANQSLSNALKIGDVSGGDKITIKISAGLSKKKSLTQSAITLIKQLKSKLDDDPDAVTKLKVGVKENIDGKTEVLDLIGHRLFVEFTHLKPGKDLRFAQQDRYDALEKAYIGWKKLL